MSAEFPQGAWRPVNYSKRYLDGDFVRVWDELQALGPEVRREPHHSQAREVAAETMRRVRRNCEVIVSRLRSMGYVFGTYPDGTRRSYAAEPPLVPPSDTTRAALAELEEMAGPLPLSLVAFWQEVGSVDLVGMHPSWPDGLDPLVVDPPEGALYWLEDTEDDTDDEGQRVAALAPDDLHKDNVSGGSPYGVALPDPSADFLLTDERHDLLFVPYLRLAILRWGGLPGLDARAERFEPLGELVAGLEPF
jgi:hypothetical protein